MRFLPETCIKLAPDDQGVKKMKDSIHPKVYKAKITCACGNEIEALSSKGEQINVEICSKCHPFYTGQQRFVDTAGRIDRFRKKYGNLQK